MAVGVRDAVRLAVTRTNDLWPLSTLHRGLYRLAIAAFLRHCARFAAVRSVYLRHGMTRADWVPGLSDIDWTVVIEEEPDAAREHAFLLEFWRGFVALKRSFPMLGEVDLLRHRSLASWCRLSIRGAESDAWQLRAGKESRVSAYERSPIRLVVDRLDHAIVVYANHLSRRSFHDRGAEELRRLELQRIAHKVCRYAGSVEPVTESPPPPRERSVARALRSLDEAVRAVSPRVLGGSEAVRLPLADPPDWAEAGDGVVSVVRGFSIRLAIVADVDDESAAAAVIARLGRLAAEGPPLVVVTPALLHYWLRVYDPFLAEQLARCGRAIRGQAIALPAPPNAAALTRRVYDQAPNVLVFPQSLECVAPTLPRSPRVVASLVERGLVIRLHADHGVVGPGYRALASECAKHYGSVLGDFAEWAGRDGGSAELHRRARSLADDVGAAVEHSAGILGGLAATALGCTAD